MYLSLTTHVGRLANTSQLLDGHFFPPPHTVYTFPVLLQTSGGSRGGSRGAKEPPFSSQNEFSAQRRL